jgi:hypothetical protein
MRRSVSNGGARWCEVGKGEKKGRQSVWTFDVSKAGRPEQAATALRDPTAHRPVLLLEDLRCEQ